MGGRHSVLDFMSSLGSLVHGTGSAGEMVGGLVCLLGSLSVGVRQLAQSICFMEKLGCDALEGREWSWIEAMARARRCCGVFPESWVTELEAASESEHEVLASLVADVVSELQIVQGAMRRSRSVARGHQLEEALRELEGRLAEERPEFHCTFMIVLLLIVHLLYLFLL